MNEAVSFRRVAFSPVGCLSESWRRIRDQYWLFVGIVAAAILVGTAAPMGLLLGPAMCGIYSTYRRKWKGERARFEHVFGGFEKDVILPSILATLAIMGLTFVFVMPLVAFALIAAFTGAMASTLRDHEALGGALVLLLGGGVVVWIGLVTVVGTLFAFTYPLIADRKLGALDALRLSVRAVFANLWRVILLHLLSTALALCGVCCCYVGAFLVAPVTMGALMVAYEQIFGLAD